MEVCYIELIVFGGIIGVGFFMGVVSMFKWVGLLVLLVYIIVGLFVFFIMCLMGEMFFLEFVIGFFVVYVYWYMSFFFGYFIVWLYWFMWMVVGILEIIVIGVYV